MKHLTKEKSLELLGIEGEYDEKQLKKKYYKKALLYHPDKNPYNEELFKHINEAYQCLRQDLNKNGNSLKNEIPNFDYSKMFEEFLHNYFKDTIHNENKNIVFKCIHMILHSSGSMDGMDILHNLKKLFEGFDMFCLDKHMDIYKEVIQFFKKHRDLFETNQESNTYIQHILTMAKTKMSKHIEQFHSNSSTIIGEKRHICIEPTLFDIYNEKIFVYDTDITIYIPTWLDEIEVNRKYNVHNNDPTDISNTTTQTLHFVIHIQPKLPKNVYIDETNNIHIYRYFDLFQLLNTEYIEIHELIKQDDNIDILKIYSRDLYMRKYQTYTFIKKGIPVIDDDDIYNNSNTSDVIIHIYIET